MTDSVCASNMVKAMAGMRVTIVGLARSGLGAANLLARLGARVTVTDRKGPDDLQGVLGRLNPGVAVVLGYHPPELFAAVDLIVVSPGVPLDSPPLKFAAENGVEVVGELELAYRLLETLTRPPAFLAVTGSNGKSTTTTLLFEMLRKCGVPCFMAGNIGNAITAEIEATGFITANCEVAPPISHVVAEVSSFQLESIEAFRPIGAAILNITPDHMDRYHAMGPYIDAKCRVFGNQGPGDFLVLNADDPVTEEVLARLKRQRPNEAERPRVVFFSREQQVEGAFCTDGLIRFNLPEGCGLADGFALDPATFNIKGVHNIENAMAAALMALMTGCGVEAVSATLASFPGLEHRLELVREIDGVKYINDSKGTNVGAVQKSLEGFNESVILIAGGRDKDSDFTVLGPLIDRKVKALVLIGEAAEKIRKAIGNRTRTFMESDLRAAVVRARAEAASGDVVLLSPACTSFDMFQDFEDRGHQFKGIVLAL